MDVKKSNIEYLLSRLFDAHIVEKGRKLFSESAVLSHSIDPKNGIIMAKVQDINMYSIKLNYNVGSNAITGLKCDCTQGSFCKHIVATMLVVQKGEERVRTVQTYTIPTQSSDEYRVIEYTSFEELQRRVQMLAPRGYQRSYEMHSLEYDITFEEDSSLKLRGLSPSFNSKKSLEALVVLVKNGDQQIEVKCEICDRESDLLCDHTYFALSHLVALPITKSYIQDEISYEDELNRFAQNEGLAVEQVVRLFDFKLNRKGISAKEKGGGYLDSEKLRKFSNVFIESLKEQYLSPADLQVDESIDDEPKLNAMMWNVTDNTKLFPEVIVGNATVTRDKIKSNIEKDRVAKHLDKDLKTKVLELATKQVIGTKDEEYLSMVNDQLSLIKANINTVLSLPQYLNEDTKYDIEDRFYTLKKTELKLLSFLKYPIDIRCSIEVRDNLCTLSTHLYVSKARFHLEEVKFIHPLFVVLNKQNQTAFFKNYFDKNTIEMLKGVSIMQFSLAKVKELYPLLFFLKDHYRLELPEELMHEINQATDGQHELYLKSSGENILFTPVINYGDGLKINAITRLPVEEADEYRYFSKDDAENLLLWLKGSHPSFEKIPRYSEFLRMTKDEFLADYWFADFFDKCKEDNVAVLGYEELELSRFNRNRPSITTTIESGIDWFDTDVHIKYGDLVVPMKTWVTMIKNKEKYIKLADGTLGIVPQEWIDKLTRIVDIADTSNDDIRISKYHFNLLDEIIDDVGSLDWYKEIRDKKDKLISFETTQTFPVPSILTADLREYQEKGYQWLRFLHEFGFGGCLADDMGLGKTVQIISLLAHTKEAGSCFALVVVPNSLLFNWSNELKKFCPSLNFMVHHGTSRDIENIKRDDFDIIITTYGTAVSDVDKLSNITFDYIVLDESQAIKNPKSKRNKAMRVLQGKNKLVLTGTPIENNTLDLFGQFNFLNPGMLGSEGEFVRNFSKPIDLNGDKEQAMMLKKLIHPFILRRTKEQVASDLPPKSEIVLYCEMGEDQRKHYDSLLNTVKQDVSQSIEENGVGKSKLKILEALLRLRQVCNATQLVDSSSRSSSTKIKTLLEHIESNEQHKCLIFSQFVGMLTLIRAELDKQGIKYAYLDGKTRDREAAVKEFQEDEECKIFLISLKAGNTGLNLTEADYVYIVDPWWNPAVEAQAIDRTHRIGQDKHIFAYRMICKNTIEEKIIKLQEKKRSLSNDLIQTDDNVFKSLDKDELMSIFD